MKGEGWIPSEPPTAQAWDRFVENHPQGRFIHLTGFRMAVEAVYGLRPNYWLYQKDGEIEAVFPSFFHRSFLYGKRLVSQPFSEYGGILFLPTLDPGRRLSVLSEFPQVVEESRLRASFDYLEIRCFPDLSETESRLFRKIPLYSYGILALNRELDLWNVVDYSVQKNIRRAQSHRLRLEITETEQAVREIFYPLH
ncbi:MAG: hypothetical protein AB1715_09595, partial [Acidobacteriota bacterium]